MNGGNPMSVIDTSFPSPTAAPTAAAGALTTYVVQFTTSASGGLSGHAGDTITVTLPSGTSLAAFHGGEAFAHRGENLRRKAQDRRQRGAHALGFR